MGLIRNLSVAAGLSVAWMGLMPLFVKSHMETIVEKNLRLYDQAQLQKAMEKAVPEAAHASSGHGHHH